MALRLASASLKQAAWRLTMKQPDQAAAQWGISRTNLAGKKTDITISVTIGIPKWEIYLNQAQRRRMALRQDGDKDEWMNAPQTPASAQRVEYSRAATRLRYYH